jgi:lysyl-tRNA synthetase class 2
MDEQSQQRRSKLEHLRESGLNPYANSFTPEHNARQIIEQHKDDDAEALKRAEAVYQIAGRIMAIRSFGKAAFLKIIDRSGSIQIFVQKNTLGDEVFGQFQSFFEVGDIVGVKGQLMRTRTGELTLSASLLQLITKGLKPLPEKWSGLKDVEIRYRRRYLDLIVNQEIRQVFETRAAIIRFIRGFLDEKGFLEVETPLMHSLAGGAAARPFVTHHNTLGMELYLRVAPELHLKRLLVGGLERVYELNRCFRNEGISTQHNPEFTMVEFYQAYATYEDMMDLTERMLSALAMELHAQTTVAFGDLEIDFSAPFARMSVHGSVAKALGVEESQLDDVETLSQLAKDHDVSVDKTWDAGKLLMALFEELVEGTLLQPTFIVDFPLSVSPLSRKKEGHEDLVDRFELYIAGREIANAFSELNDPDDQRERFSAQMEAKAAGDDEAMPFDEDYVLALEYGMPSAAGEGIGIDRLVMLMTNSQSIRDVILFPLMKAKNES